MTPQHHPGDDLLIAYAAGSQDEPVALVVATLSSHFSALVHNFRDNNMPWSECRSLIAGASGILYALPIFVVNDRVEQLVWCIQASLSIMADYVHIQHDSM